MRTQERNPVDTKKLWKFADKLRALLKKEFGADDEGDPRVELELVDRSRFFRPYCQPVPYSHLCETPEDYLEVLRVTIGNLQTAAERARIEVDCYRRLREQQTDLDKLKKALKRVFRDVAFELESSYGFYESKQPWHYWAKVTEAEMGQAKESASGGSRYKFTRGSEFTVKDDLKPFVAYVRKCKTVLDKRHKKAIQGYIVCANSYGGFVVALVKMSEKEIADAKVRIAARRRLMDAEEAKVRAEAKEKEKKK
jgi:hypothetical protein